MKKSTSRKEENKSWRWFRKNIKPSTILIITIFTLIFYSIGIIRVWSAHVKGPLSFGLSWNVVIGFAFPYAFLIIILYLLIKLNRLTRERHGLKSTLIDNLNGYVLFSAFLILFVSSFGLNMIDNIYSPSLPYEKDVDFGNAFNDSIEKLTIKCDNKHHEPIIGYDLSCEIDVSYKENATRILNDVRVYYFEGGESKNKVYKEYNNQVSFELTLNNEGSNEFNLEYLFEYLDRDDTFNSKEQVLSFDVISYIDYKNDRSKVFTYKFSLISIALFSIVAFVRNLKNLMEPKENKQ